MRTFIAIALPPEVKETLGKLQDELKTAQADVKWVEPENIHLTLKFLGEIDEEQLQELSVILDGIGQKTKSFTLELAGIGAFPKIQFPRVIWVGATKGNEEAAKIAQVIEDESSKVGIPKEDRAFSSHITLGRVRSPLHLAQLTQRLMQLLQGEQIKCAPFTVRSVTLFKSALSPAEPRYERLKEVSLINI